MPPADLAAFVFTLVPIRLFNIQQHMGRAARYFVLSLLPDTYGQEFHAGGHTLRPYCAAGPFLPGGVTAAAGTITPHTPVWFRVTALRADVVAGLDRTCERWESGALTTLEFDRTQWRIVAIAREQDDHAWAGQASYAMLEQIRRSGPPPDSLTLHFAAPTAFRSQGMDWPLPDPAHVFGSLINRWKAFTDAPLPDHLADFAAHYLQLGRYDLQAETLRFDPRTELTGFMGKVTYQVQRGASDKLKKDSPEIVTAIKQSHDALAQSLDMLGLFAFFSGVGKKLTAGMGMVRRC